MGLLTDPGATKNLSSKIDKFGDKLGAVSFVAGLAWLVAQSCAQYNAASYIDENALMPGLAKTRFTREHEQLSLKVMSELNECTGGGERQYRACQMEKIEKYAQLMGHRSEQSSWSYCGRGGGCVDGVNLVVQSRIKSSLDVESIIINVPLYSEHDELNRRQRQNHGVGVAISLMEMIKRQSHWAKQFHFVFTEHARRGIECWSEHNFGLIAKCTHTSAPSLIAHSPQSGLVLDIASEQFTAVDLQMEGDLSQMTNQDIVNVAVRVANRLGIAVTIGGQTGPTDPGQPSRLFLAQLVQLGTGEGTGNHATLIAHGIQALTLKTTSAVTRKVNYRLLNVMHLAELVLRSENNLLERLHASIWFYMFSSINHYASISLYMPTAGLLVALPLLFGLKESGLILNKTFKYFLLKSNGKRWLTSGDIKLGDFAEQMRPVMLLAFLVQLVTFGGLTLVRLHGGDYVVPVCLVCLVAVPLLSLVFRRSYHPKVSAAVILIYSLQCGLLSLVCFSQGSCFFLLIQKLSSTCFSPIPGPWRSLRHHCLQKEPPAAACVGASGVDYFGHLPGVIRR